MRLLTGICAFQTAMMVVLFVLLSGVESKTERIEAHFAQQNETLAAELAALRAASYATGGDRAAQPIQATGLSAGEMKRIVREEIASLAHNSTRETGADKSPTAAPTPEQQAKRNFVRQRVDGLIGRGGRINEAELSGLFAELAELAPEHRKEAMSRLISAANAGRIEAQF